MRDIIQDEYFEWLFELVCGHRFSKKTSFRKLLMLLHGTEFKYTIRRDRHRAADGVDLRRRFALSQGRRDLDRYLDDPCSMLEMMIALAIHCEESIMDNPLYGDRTSQWFWNMVKSLGLGSMTDDRFDKDYVQHVLKRFFNHDYAPNGEGGLFTIRNCDSDLRNVEIWYQLCWYLDSIT